MRSGKIDSTLLDLALCIQWYDFGATLQPGCAQHGAGCPVDAFPDGIQIQTGIDGCRAGCLVIERLADDDERRALLCLPASQGAAEIMDAQILYPL